MRKDRWQAWSVLALGVALGLGCRSEEKPSMGPPQPRRALAHYPDYNKDATKANKHDLDFDESGSGVFDAYLPCDNGEDCKDSGGNNATEIHFKIIPETRAHVAPMEAALKRAGNEENLGGYIVAKVINMDQTHRFYGFKMEPHDTAYLWAGPTRQKGNAFAIYRIHEDGTSDPLASAQTASICRRGNFNHAEVHSPPRYCGTIEPIYGGPAPAAAAAPTVSSQIRLASNPIQPSAFLVSLMHTTGLWISCSGGCCQTGGWAPM